MAAEDKIDDDIPKIGHVAHIYSPKKFCSFSVTTLVLKITMLKVQAFPKKTFTFNAPTICSI